MSALSSGGVGDLIVILQIVDQRPRRQASRWRTAALVLPRIALALIEISALGHSDELAGVAAIVVIIAVGAAGQPHHCRMMEVVVPNGIHAMPTPLSGPHHPHVLRF